MKKPLGRRWRENGNEVVITPHWGHSFAAGLILLVNVVILGALALRPEDGKHFPWYMLVFIGLCEAALVAWFTYPFWGKTRLSFEGGIFRLEKTIALTLGELQRFDTEPSDSGVAVIAVKNDGTRIPLDLPLGNPLTSEQSKFETERARTKRRNHGRAEADFAASRLTELLATARTDPANYRG